MLTKGMLPALLFLSVLLSSNSALADDGGWWNKGKSLFDGLFGEGQVQGLTVGDMSDGLKEALRVGTENVVRQLGREGGFNLDSNIRIELPKQLEVVRSTLDKVGMGSMLNDLELRLNRAAEEATPKAKALFWNAIKEMSIDDVKRIFNGADDAATSYFRDKMSEPLKEAMRPVINKSLSEVGVVQSYDRIIGRYESIPFVPDVKANLTDYTMDKSLDGVFHYLALEEAAIRKDPLKRSTELLRKVFEK